MPCLENVVLGIGKQEDSLVRVLECRSLKVLHIRDITTLGDETAQVISSDGGFTNVVRWQRPNANAVQGILQALSSPSLPTGDFTSTTALVSLLASSEQRQLACNLETLRIPFYEINVPNVIQMICSSPSHNGLTRLEFHSHNDWLLPNSFYSDIITSIASALRLNKSLKTIIMPEFLDITTHRSFNQPYDEHERNERRRNRTIAVRPNKQAQRRLLRTLKDHNMTLQELVWPGWTVDYYTGTEGEDDTDNNNDDDREYVDWLGNLAKLQYYFDLNRMGRKRIFESQSSTATGDRADVWLELLFNAGSNLNCLYYILRMNPSLCKR